MLKKDYRPVSLIPLVSNLEKTKVNNSYSSWKHVKQNMGYNKEPY